MIDKEKELVLKVMPMPSDTNIHGDIFGGWIMSPPERLERILLQILLFGWIPSKKEDSKTPINSLRILKMSIFILPSGMNTIMKPLLRKF